MHVSVENILRTHQILWLLSLLLQEILHLKDVMRVWIDLASLALLVLILAANVLHQVFLILLVLVIGGVGCLRARFFGRAGTRI